MIHTMKQHSDEWFEIRKGKKTGSRGSDIIKGIKGNYLAGRKNYMAEIVIEILTGESQEHFVSEAMQWGTDNEPLARSAYEATTGNFVDEVGFITHETIKDFGSSPDGLISTYGSIEIKCPNSATHFQSIIKGTVKREYIIQMQCLMSCDKNIKWCDFVSFDPRMPENLQLYIKRFTRDEVMIAEIEFEVKKFQAELQEMLKQLNAYKE